MGKNINFNQLQYEELMHLGNLAAEAMALSHEYDRAQAAAFCNLIVACNAEMLARKRRAMGRCGTAAQACGDAA